MFCPLIVSIRIFFQRRGVHFQQKGSQVTERKGKENQIPLFLKLLDSCYYELQQMKTENPPKQLKISLITQ